MTLVRLLAPAWPHGRRAWLAFAGLIVAALLAFLPLRLAVGLAGIGDSALAARSASGTVWQGRLADARLGDLGLGTLDLSLRPWPLLLARTQFDVARPHAMPLRGQVELSGGTRGVRSLTGQFAGASLAGLPFSGLSADALTVVFAGDRCVEANGRVRLLWSGGTAPVASEQALSGVVRCDNGALLLPLTADSGIERLMVRITGDGRYLGTLGTSTGAAPMRIEGRL